MRSKGRDRALNKERFNKTGSVYCYVCKIFHRLQISEKLTPVHQFESGYDKWKNINIRMEAYEQSINKDYFNSIKKR